MVENRKKYWTNDFKDAQGNIDKGKIVARSLLVLFCIYITWYIYDHFSIIMAIIMAIFFMIVILGSIIAKRKRYENKLGWYIGAYWVTVFCLFALILFLKSLTLYKPDKVLIHPPEPSGLITVQSNHIYNKYSFKKGDQVEIWSRGEYYVKAFINAKQSYVDSIQGIKKFSTYITPVWPDKVPEDYKKTNELLGKTMTALYPGFIFSVSPYKQSESFPLRFLKDVDSLYVIRHPDSLFATSVYFDPQGFWGTDVEKLQIILGTILLCGIWGVVRLLKKARNAPRDDSPEAKANKRSKMKFKKNKRAYKDEPNRGVQKPQPGTAMTRIDMVSGVPARSEDTLSTARNMIMGLVADIEKQQAKQNELTEYSGGMIGTKWVLYKDQLIKRVKESKIADIEQINRLIEELINLRDKTRELYTSDMKDQEEVLRRKIEITKLESELYKLLPKSEEDNKKEAIRIRYTPLLRRHQLEGEAERLIFYKSSVQKYEKDIKEMLKNAENSEEKKSGPIKSDFDMEKERCLNEVEVEKFKMRKTAEKIAYKEEQRKYFVEKFPDNKELVDRLMDELDRELFEK